MLNANFQSHAATDATLTMLVVIRFTCKRRVAQKCALHRITYVLFLWSIRTNLPQLYSVVALCSHTSKRLMEVRCPHVHLEKCTPKTKCLLQKRNGSTRTQVNSYPKYCTQVNSYCNTSLTQVNSYPGQTR